MASRPVVNEQLQPVVRSSTSTSPQRVAWIAERLTAAELSKPGPELDAFTKKLLFRLWLGTLEEIGEEAFDKALELVMHTSTFRPDIAEIRKAAGVNRGIVDPVEHEALSQLTIVFMALRKHGQKLQPIRGEILNDGRDNDGRIMALPRRAPWVSAPAFSEATETAISALGYGDRLAGLQALMAHPAMLCEAEGANTASYRVRNAQWVEKQWLAAYANAIKRGTSCR